MAAPRRYSHEVTQRQCTSLLSFVAVVIEQASRFSEADRRLVAPMFRDDQARLLANNSRQLDLACHCKLCLPLVERTRSECTKLFEVMIPPVRHSAALLLLRASQTSS